MNNPNGYQSTPRKSSSLRPIGDIARPIAKRLIITAYCNGWLSKQQTQKLFHDLDLGGC